MKLQVLSVYDVKMGEFSGLYLVPTLEVGVRMFGDAVNSGDTEIRKHPEDFALWKVGDYLTTTGVLVGCTPAVVIAASEVVRRTMGPAAREGQIDIEDAIAEVSRG